MSKNKVLTIIMIAVCAITLIGILFLPYMEAEIIGSYNFFDLLSEGGKVGLVDYFSIASAIAIAVGAIKGNFKTMLGFSIAGTLSVFAIIGVIGSSSDGLATPGIGVIIALIGYIASIVLSILNRKGSKVDTTSDNNQ